MTSELSPWIDVCYRAGNEHAGLRADVFLRFRMQRRSRVEIQAWMTEGKVLRRGRALKPSDKIASGDSVLVRFARREDPPARHEELPVVYEDQWILAINKPGSLLCHPTDKIRKNSVTEILTHRAGKPLYLAHRLDRETSGLLLLAKTKDTARNLTGQFLSRAIEKRYLALVRGRVSWAAKEFDAPLERSAGEIWVKQEVSKSGAPALTRFKRLAAAQEASLIEARPKTGRLHQIRAHLSRLGHPILGDKLYQNGGSAYLKMTRGQITDQDLTALGAARQMLHSWTLTLSHPESGQALHLSAPAPEDFVRACLEWGLACPK